MRYGLSQVLTARLRGVSGELFRCRTDQLASGNIDVGASDDREYRTNTGTSKFCHLVNIHQESCCIKQGTYNPKGNHSLERFASFSDKFEFHIQFIGCSKLLLFQFSDNFSLKPNDF